jgi:hypothetical protein
MFKQACAVLAAFSLLVLIGCGGGDAPPSKPAGGGSASTPKPAGGGEKKSSAKKEAAPKDAKGSVKGAVAFDGEAPKRKQIDVGGDKFCAANHEKEPLLTDEIIVKDGKLANVIVYVKTGAEKWEFTPPTEPAKIDQHGCHYVPHIVVMMAGQPLEVLNSDETTHNIHGVGKENPEFNISQASAGKKDTLKKLESAELPYNVGCDVHKWMKAKIGVFDHPFFAVTGEDGAFELKGLPDGDYELEAWHETLPAQSAKVTIKDGAAASANFTFKK